MDAPLPLLVLDCSTRWCVLALRSSAGVFRFAADLDRAHSQRLLPAIEALRAEAGLGSTPIAGVGVVVGPGSFTGVRIAVATAQALAFAFNCPVARLDALAVLAESAPVAVPAGTGAQNAAGIVCCARRSRADLYYLGAYLQQARGSCRVGELELISSTTTLEAWWGGCREAAERNGLKLPADATGADWIGDTPPWIDRPVRVVDPGPDALLKVAERAFAEDQVVVAADALPLYLSADSPWQRSTS